MLAALLDLLAPPACLACRGPGRELCGACRRGLVFLDGPTQCLRCALPVPAGVRHRCPAAGAPWRAAWAPVAYAGPATALVTALKFRAAPAAARVMAAQLAAGLPDGLVAPGAVLVPVPTHPARVRARGYDQAAVLARAVAGRTGLPLTRCLTRHGSAERQLGARREERLRAGRLDLGCTGPVPRAAVLVDDVHTTGATLRAAAAALRTAGAGDVVAITWARTL